MFHVIDWVIPSPVLYGVAATWPKEDWPHWHRYKDEHADKFATTDALRLPAVATLALNLLASTKIAYTDETAYLKPFPDLNLHGAGLHMCKPGGYLKAHYDGARHPITGWRRVANAIVFLDDWEDGWGGHLVAYDGVVTHNIQPRFGRVVVFTADLLHEVTQITGPKNRRTLSLFWWSESPPTCERDRADFKISEIAEQAKSHPVTLHG